MILGTRETVGTAEGVSDVSISVGSDEGDSETPSSAVGRRLVVVVVPTVGE